MVDEQIGEAVVDGAPRPIRINTHSHHVELWVGDKEAFILFRLREPVLSLIHTEVPPALKGKGLADTLARATLDYARAHALRVKVICPFVAKFIQRHPEYQNLSSDE